jgi:HSP20 family molecular chaperone IbpA
MSAKKLFAFSKNDFIIFAEIEKSKKEVRIMVQKWKNKNRFYPTMPFFDHFFEHMFNEDGWSKNPMLIDVVEKNDEFQIKANLPEFKRDEIAISTRQNQLIIEATHQENKEKKKGKTVITERYCGNYHRSITLPNNSKPEEIKASMKNGVLTITIPKAEEKKPKQITIE